jgi:hypothetical protein
MGGATPPIDSDENPVVRDGLEVWERLKAASRMTLKDWLIVGAALVEGRTHAIAAAKTNKPSGPKYSQQFHFWMEINGFAEIDKATRSKLLWLMESWPQVEKWLEGKTKAERVKWNHPHTIWVAFRCTKRGIKAVLEKAEAPIPNPKDLPPGALCQPFEADR